ncbi:hypothetical protein [Nonomuraea recticatena]|uniref:Uncharacterized protein n=1 Tax=Nonomuraea recticatena TaxID=46178 RepID=A0ABN3T2P5_9ACTN
MDDVQLALGANGLVLLVVTRDKDTPAAILERAHEFANGDDLVIHPPFTGAPRIIRWMRPAEHSDDCLACYGADGLHYQAARPNQGDAFLAVLIPCSVLERTGSTEHPPPPLEERVTIWQTTGFQANSDGWQAAHLDDSAPRGFYLRHVPGWLVQEATEFDRAIGAAASKTRIVAAYARGAELVPVDEAEDAFWMLVPPGTDEELLEVAYASEHEPRPSKVVTRLVPRHPSLGAL